jgi:S1-C subfamily serine protease
VAGVIGASLVAVAGMATGGYRHTVVVHPVERFVNVPSTIALASVSSAVGAVTLSPAIKSSLVTLVFNGAGGQTIASGVVIRSDGCILTEGGLVAGATSVRVMFADGTTAPAQILGQDPSTDVAVLKMSGGNAHVATLASQGVQPGEMVMAAGSSRTGVVVTTGLVTSLDATVPMSRSGNLFDMIGTDARISPADRGGAVLDSSGAVIGLIASPAYLSAAASSETAYAIPISTALGIADQIMSTGHVSHSWLGITGENLDQAMIDKLGILGGARIVAVEDRSPAARAGLKADDVITAINRTPVSSMDGLAGTLLSLKGGERVELTILRGGRPMTATAVLGTRAGSS